MARETPRWRPTAGADELVLLDDAPRGSWAAHFAVVFADYVESRGRALRIARVRTHESEALENCAVVDFEIASARERVEQGEPGLAHIDPSIIVQTLEAAGWGRRSTVIVGGEGAAQLCLALRDRLGQTGEGARAVLALSGGGGGAEPEPDASPAPPLGAFEGVLYADPLAELFAQTEALGAAELARLWHRSLSAWTQWPSPARGWRRDHTLAHAVAHRLGAGQWDAALALYRRLDFLTAGLARDADPKAEGQVSEALRAGLGVLLGAGEQGEGLELEQRQRLAELERVLFVLGGQSMDIAARLWNAMLGECRDAQALERWFGAPPAAPLRLRHPLHTRMCARTLLLGGSVQQAVTALAVNAAGELAVGCGTRGARSAAPRWEVLVPELDGVHIAALVRTQQGFVSGGDHLAIWPQRGGEALRSLELASGAAGGRGQVRALAVVGGLLHVGYEDGWLETWALEGEERVARRQVGSGNAIEFIVDLGVRGVAIGDGTDVFDVPAQGNQWRHEGCVTAMAAVPEQDLVVCGDNGGALYAWTPETHARGLAFVGHSGRINALLVTAEGWLVSGSDDRSVRVWDPATGAQLACLRGHAQAVTALALGPEGTLFSGGADGELRAWARARVGSDRRAASSPYVGGHGGARREAHLGPIRGLAWADAQTLLTAAVDGSVCAWDATRGELLARTSSGERGSVEVELQGLARSALGLFVAPTCHAGLRVYTWEAEGQILRELGDPIVAAEGDAFVTGFCPGPGELVVASDLHGKLRVWDIESREQILCLPCPGEPPLRHALSSTGMIATASAHRLWLWDPRTGETLASIDGLEGQPRCLAAGAGERVLFLSAPEGRLHAWNPVNGHIERSVVRLPGCSSFVVRDDGLVLALCGAQLLHCRWGWSRARLLCRGELPFTNLKLRGEALAAGDALGNPHFFDVDWSRIGQ